ncbi:uncharacterized protein [Dermacentor andersoni]|uniref:uncharacterized protein n=1 Tax=Dermacentor andersoni TaxID=34620 RepID=UPI0024162329|nr:uncharacterized protein LOC129385453 [Dermacentor andersoni]
MRTEVCLVLPLLFAPAFVGAGQSKQKDLPGYDGNLEPDPLGSSSPCGNYTLTRVCQSNHNGYHYNRQMRLCFKSDSKHCGNYPNIFGSCDDCVLECKVSVCSEETTPPPFKLPHFSPMGR